MCPIEMNETKPKLTLPQSRRLKMPGDFERCYARKRSASDAILIVYACENGLTHSRLGVSVSKKLGGAVVRNRHKRMLREAFRLVQHELPAVDLILIPRPGTKLTLASVKESLIALAREAAAKLGPKKPDGQAPGGSA
jgi:ribonuclease P protein component